MAKAAIKNIRQRINYIKEKIRHNPTSITSSATAVTELQSAQHTIDKLWLNLQHHDRARTKIIKPDELESFMREPSSIPTGEIFDKFAGSIFGLALGDAVGAYVEFRPYEYLLANPVTELRGGGTWGLQKGQFTDDTSMALCLAISLVVKRDFNLYDQLVRYKWWYKEGYMSSTGQCFDIGEATKNSIQLFILRQNLFGNKHNILPDKLDYISDDNLLKTFDVYCSQTGVAGNGALMRLAPVPLFFYQSPVHAVEYSGQSGQITHGDIKAYDACRYYGALIVAALLRYSKDDILDTQFYAKHKPWFSNIELCDEIRTIAEGSYRKPTGYDGGIRGKGYIVNALEAALWAFWSDEDSFEKGALAAVNLGDDTDTTAAIYGQLAGAYYGYEKLPKHWLKHIYAKDFMLNVTKWLSHEGSIWEPIKSINQSVSKANVKSSDLQNFELENEKSDGASTETFPTRHKMPQIYPTFSTDSFTSAIPKEIHAIHEPCDQNGISEHFPLNEQSNKTTKTTRSRQTQSYCEGSKGSTENSTPDMYQDKKISQTSKTKLGRRQADARSSEIVDNNGRNVEQNLINSSYSSITASSISTYAYNDERTLANTKQKYGSRTTANTEIYSANNRTNQITNEHFSLPTDNLSNVQSAETSLASTGNRIAPPKTHESMNDLDVKLSGTQKKEKRKHQNNNSTNFILKREPQ